MRLCQASIISLLLLTSPLAHAQSQEDPSAPTDASRSSEDSSENESLTRESSSSAATSAASSTTDNSQTRAAEKEEVKLLYQRGKEAYAAGDYEEALNYFTQVYERTNHPALLFNMAQAHRLAGPSHCKQAHDRYIEYLVRDAHVPNSDEVRERIKELEPCAKSAEAQEAALPVHDEAAPETKGTPLAAPITTITGGLVLLTGIGLFTAAKIKYAQAKEDCPCDPEELSTWTTLEKVGVGAMVVGGAGVTAGSIWWSASASPKRGTEHVFISLSGTF